MVTLAVTLTIAVLALAPIAIADVPQMINYQGRLTDSLGNAVTGTFNVLFAIYDQAADGSVLWQEQHSDLNGNPVDVQNGLFSVLLGEVIPISDTVFNDTVRWLGIKVGSDPEVSPRTRLVTVPYAYRVATIDGSTGGVVSENVEIDGHVGIGLAANDSATLRVQRIGVDGPPVVHIRDSSQSWALTVDQLHPDGGRAIRVNKTGIGGAVEIVKMNDGVALEIHHYGTGPALRLTKDSTETLPPLMKVETNGTVGIGTNTPSELLEVAGTIYSNTGGFKFPDGSVQTTAASTGQIVGFGRIVRYTTEVSTNNTAWTALATLTVPANEVTVYISILSKVRGTAVHDRISPTGTSYGELRITIDDVQQINLAPAKPNLGTSGGTVDGFESETFMTYFYKPTAEQKLNGFVIKIDGRIVESGTPSWQGSATHIETDIWGI